MTSVTEGVLGFWIKNGLLVPSSGGQGKGSHRKFSPIQVSIAAILGQMQQFGLNIGSLSSFAQILQHGAAISAPHNLHPASLREAVWLRELLYKFSRGEKVTVSDRMPDENGKITSKYRPAQSIEEVALYCKSSSSEYDRFEFIAHFSSQITEDDFQAIEAYSEILTQMEADDGADFSWLLWQDENLNWQIGSQTEEGEQFTNPPKSESAIFIALGKIIRRVWSIDSQKIAQHRHEQREIYLTDRESIADILLGNKPLQKGSK